ncbi:uncharacterized protein TRUGW13939_10372 [Talaromyces rugulosus]|uniref:Uncharacterized protein n=1 Tax=Talaromyces rugulosus TaxID=121627 RepID=A0A7H8RF90_TALRU|nr:uncharacterized protein TRUGW13939_10372 [Talaromyces rugulosus]QKX63203.1 hypothetical protein TRUGW13939_10372 [Talaromyces rugulosus]
MNKANRKQLLYEIKIRQKEFDDPSLRALASDNGILCSAVQVDSETQQQNRDQMRNESYATQGRVMSSIPPLEFQQPSTEQIQTMQNSRQIDFLFSNGPVNHMSQLRNYVDNAMQSSHHWRAEREAEEPTTECLTAMIPRDENADISITIWVGQTAGMELLEILRLQPTWSSSQGHL